MKSMTAPAPAPPQRASDGTHLKTAVGVLLHVKKERGEVEVGVRLVGTLIGIETRSLQVWEDVAARSREHRVGTMKYGRRDGVGE